MTKQQRATVRRLLKLGEQICDSDTLERFNYFAQLPALDCTPVVRYIDRTAARSTAAVGRLHWRINCAPLRALRGPAEALRLHLWQLRYTR